MSSLAGTETTFASILLMVSVVEEEGEEYLVGLYCALISSMVCLHAQTNRHRTSRPMNTYIWDFL